MMKRVALVVLLLACNVPVWAAGPSGHPAVAIRVDQALLETPAVVAAETQAINGKVKDLQIRFKDDGLHINGKYPIPILPDIQFEALISFVWTGPNVFEVRVHRIRVFIFNVTGLVLDSVQAGLAEALKGVCTFSPGPDAPDAPDGSQVLRVNVDMKALLPALPMLQLSGIVTHDKLLILKTQLP